MRLSNFIRQSSNEIVGHSVDFARSLEPLANDAIDIAILRDHLPLVLEAIATDLDTPQTRDESIRKSQGRADSIVAETAAETHGRLRASTGLSIEQVVAEFRVLRAVVIRLWLEAITHIDAAQVMDLVRFNEAIDQAIAESVTFHSTEVGRWRDMMLAVISHDLRGPLQAVVGTTEVLSLKASELYAPYVGAISRSVLRLTQLLDSLLDYSKAQLGSGLPLEKSEVDLSVACEAEIELLRAAHPVATIEFAASGLSIGSFDAGRIREALANLVSNAVQYRSPGTAIRVSVHGTAHDVTVTVVNQGEEIPTESLHGLFEPLRRRELENPAGPRRNLGIGLFVVREIAKAHGGEAGARASGGESTFFLRVPKHVDNNSAGA